MTSDSVARLRPGDHYCGLYHSDAEQLAVIEQFVRDGVARRERMLYVVNVHTAAELRDRLGASGFDVDRLVRDGQLVILTAKDAYLKDGEFDPHKMIALCQAEVDRALAEGFTGLRITGEMTWALAGEPGSERLIEYESMLNEFFPGKEVTGVCQYDRRRFDAEVLLDVLHTHPRVLVGTDGFDNEDLYYVPPDAFLGADRQAGILDRWVRNLAHRAADGTRS